MATLGVLYRTSAWTSGSFVNISTRKRRKASTHPALRMEKHIDAAEITEAMCLHSAPVRSLDRKVWPAHSIGKLSERPAMRQIASRIWCAAPEVVPIFEARRVSEIRIIRSATALKKRLKAYFAKCLLSLLPGHGNFFGQRPEFRKLCKVKPAATDVATSVATAAPKAPYFGQRSRSPSTLATKAITDATKGVTESFSAKQTTLQLSRTRPMTMKKARTCR
mmetsp:Transcript_53893/g.126378  ORF Transcript_53893/g.126378 Transcript_53893/m.126378 type:complete len:221 (-) Transcript_53893:441-1103(-)